MIEPSGREGTRVLVLAPFPPDPAAANGGARALAESLARIAERHRVALLHLHEPGESGVPPRLAERLELVLPVARPGPRASALARTADLAGRTLSELRGIPAWVRQCHRAAFAREVQAVAGRFAPQVVEAVMAPMAQYFACVPRGCARVLIDYDPQAAAALDRWRERRRAGRGVLAGLDWRAWRGWETPAVRTADAAVVLTEADRQRLQAPAETPVFVSPLPLEIPARPLDPAGTESPSVLFVGNFTHQPNAEGARALLQQVLPAVRRQVPDVRAWIVGPEPPDDVVAAAADGVAVTGRVPDVVPFLERASVVVAPIWSGGGMRVKVLEALSAGKAVVATPLAAAGLGLVAGEQILLGEHAPDIAQAVSSLLLDPTERVALAMRARAWAEARAAGDSWLARHEAVWRQAARGAAEREDEAAMPAVRPGGRARRPL